MNHQRSLTRAGHCFDNNYKMTIIAIHNGKNYKGFMEIQTINTGAV